MNTEQEKFNPEEHLIYSSTKKNGVWETAIEIAPGFRTQPSSVELTTEEKVAIERERKLMSQARDAYYKAVTAPKAKYFWSPVMSQKLLPETGEEDASFTSWEGSSNDWKRTLSEVLDQAVQGRKFLVLPPDLLGYMSIQSGYTAAEKESDHPYFQQVGSYKGVAVLRDVFAPTDFILVANGDLTVGATEFTNPVTIKVKKK
jgi:hypothetical protein